MQYRLCAAILAAATLDVAMAHPSAHQGHQRLHNRNADAAPNAGEPNWNDASNYAGVDFNTIDYSSPQQPTPAPQAPKYGTPSEPKNKGAVKAPSYEKEESTPKKESTPKDSGSGKSSNDNKTNGKCAPGGGDWGICPPHGTGEIPKGSGYETRGNTGKPPGSQDCGCNIQPLCSGASKSGYDYTNTFKSKAKTPRKIVLWNTVGCDSGSPLSGKSVGEGGTTEFTLEPGKEQVVVIQKGSKINWCDYTDGGSNGDDSSRKCVYGEAELGFKDGWSAYDVSHLRNGGGKCGMNILVSGSKPSTCTENCYKFGDEYVENIAPVLAPGPVHMTTEIMDPA
ncbi:MAG: hypothetical protein M1831_002806 [Alyxoria varia]|nr:MAG: hypothetical protein M1831_002806 [Alyxoria varia]